MIGKMIFNKLHARQMLNKVPEITIYFWIIKVLCTTVGETASDYLNINLNLGLTGTSIITGILLAIVLYFQFRAKKYVPGIYWVTVVLISIFGTLVTDNLTDAMGVPLEISTIVFTILLALTFAIWFYYEKTLAIHTIFTSRREAFYWLAILFTFALGTASGDLMAESLGLGYLVTGIIVCAVVATLAIAWRLGLDSVLAFWLIYIMTRPLGASLGDYLSQPAKYGGLDFGATVTSAIFLFAILATVVFLSLTKKDIITKEAIVEEKAELKQPNTAWQVAVTICILIIISGAGYYWRQASLQAGANNAFANSQTQNNSSNPVLSSSSLGDLSSFRTITQDTLNFVNSGDMSDAKTRLGDLEYEWDNATARLKSMDRNKWTEIDSAVDNTLRQLHARNQDAAQCESSLKELLNLLSQN